MSNDFDRAAVIAARQATIKRAVDHMTHTDFATIRAQIASTDLPEVWRIDTLGMHAILWAALAKDASWHRVASAHVGALKVLQAAGLSPFDPSQPEVVQ